MKKELQLTIDGRLDKNNKVEAGQFCLYVQAINQENAMRKVRAMLRRKTIRNKLLKQDNNG